MYVKSKEAQGIFHVSGTTLQNWANSGKITTIFTKGGHRRFKILSSNPYQDQQQKFIYCRVSSKKQQTDLGKQIQYIREQFPEHKVISDIASGLNFKRKGFKTILEHVLNGNVKEIVVAHKDRLMRFGFELFEQICHKFNTKIIVLSNTMPKEELSEDIMAIITVFTAKYYGQRKYQILQKNKNIS